MLEEMSAFFERRLDGYDEHMRTGIEGAGEFYPFTASELSTEEGCRILDLGCGTGLELEEYFALNPTARVTGIDLSEGMLSALRSKFQDREIELICGSYFSVPLESEAYDAAVSVESLHHFTAEEKLPLYRKLCRALKKNGFFILTDYFAESAEQEKAYFDDLRALKEEQGIKGDLFYHYDTPLTVAHETEILRTAGFSEVRVLRNWGATYTVKASRWR